VIKRVINKLIVSLIVVLVFSIATIIIIKPFLKDNSTEASELVNSQLKVVKTKEPNSNKISTNPMTMLKADGNRITNSINTDIKLKGLMPPDLSVLKKDKRFNKAFFEEIKNTGANVVRIPVHPDLFVKDKDYIDKYLVPAVTWTNELGLYAIIDLHYIGNIVTGEGEQMPKISVDSNVLAKEFWIKISSLFKDYPNVIFEICNEPTAINATQWYECANGLVALIREQGAKQLVIVGGIQYSQDLSWVKETPITDDNIAYASHIYPAHSSGNWDGWFGEVSKLKPVIITEWGFIDENRDITKQQYLVGDKETYGKPFVDYLDKNNIGWVACWYDDTWEPQMFKSHSKNYTNYGSFIMQKLK